MWDLGKVFAASFSSSTMKTGSISHRNAYSSPLGREGGSISILLLHTHGFQGTIPTVAFLCGVGLWKHEYEC